MQDNDNENWVDDSETDSELENDHNTEAWKYFEQEGSFAVTEINSEDDEDNNELDLLLDSESENEDEFYSQLDLSYDACSHALSNFDLIEKEFKNAIFNSLEKNWYDFYEIRLVATLLDPRTKKMISFTSREREKARMKLRDEFEKLQRLIISSNSQLEQKTLPIASEIIQNSFFESIFGVQDHEDIAPLDEVIRYLDLAPIDYNTNSWQWWNNYKSEFSILSILARRYLCIPVTLVLCERLFSDAGNLIISKRTRLGSNIIGKMLFLKRNDEYPNMS
ncbi:38862_t:CDS:2 [Gigaspora margarita]|uniref:38862_t:CDS:1 n=1 Tax=Gigaspora margarita TaxID=4874 RepID=A0ABN7VIF1_GIGMA|nr:38862_t:CDS:2 [Gigaspora margarita]